MLEVVSPSSHFNSVAPPARTPPLAEHGEFRDTFHTLMQAQLNIAGGASGSLMAMLMLTVLEKLLTQFSQGQAATTSGVVGAVARFTHINHFEAEQQLGDGRNTNCGPAALVMALRAVGCDIAGAAPGINDGQAVALARRAMATDPRRDDLTDYGQAAEFEVNNLIGLEEIQHGAQASGATTQRLAPNAESARQALLRGASVVLSGTFAGKSPLPWISDHENAAETGDATGHFVVVTAYDANSGYFLVHDPARRTPLAVSGPTLECFMRGNAGALAISR